jgi:hypothetical protein
MTVRRRSAMLAGMAAFVPVLAGLALTGTPAASAHPLSPAPAPAGVQHLHHESGIHRR